MTALVDLRQYVSFADGDVTKKKKKKKKKKTEWLSRLRPLDVDTSLRRSTEATNILGSDCVMES